MYIFCTVVSSSFFLFFGGWWGGGSSDLITIISYCIYTWPEGVMGMCTVCVFLF